MKINYKFYSAYRLNWLPVGTFLSLVFLKDDGIDMLVKQNFDINAYHNWVIGCMFYPKKFFKSIFFSNYGYLLHIGFMYISTKLYCDGSFKKFINSMELGTIISTAIVL